jgi:hypothetical protein
MSEHSPLARLVLFLVCLAIAGSLVAGTHYYAIDLPQQNSLQAPENAVSSTINCNICRHNCLADPDISVGDPSPGTPWIHEFHAKPAGLCTRVLQIRNFRPIQPNRAILGGGNPDKIGTI